MIQELRNSVEKQLEILQNTDVQLLSIHTDFSPWNGAQCLMHMCLATELYLHQIEKKLPQLRPVGSPHKTGFWAAKFIKGLAPTDSGEIKNKMKTLKAFQPDAPRADTTLERLSNDLKTYLSILDACEGKDLRSFRVTTALGPILKFNLGDALLFVHAHNQRHFLQLERILESAKVASAPA